MPQIVDVSTDPMLPRIPITLSGTQYELCFTFEALRIAEAKLRAIGEKANLLHSLDLSNMDANSLVSLLFASMITHQPDTTPEEAAKLVTMKNMGKIFEGIVEAYSASFSEPDADAGDSPTDPPQPGQ